MRFKIDWASLIDGRKFTVSALFNFVFEDNFQVQAVGGGGGGAYIWRGYLTKGFCVTSLGSYIWRGLYMDGLIFGILRYVFFVRCS